MFARVVRISRLLFSFRGFAVTANCFAVTRVNTKCRRIEAAGRPYFSRKITRDSARRVGETGPWSQSV